MFCSQFITALLLTSYGKQYEITWTLFPDTVLLTAGFFILSFLVVGLSNTRAIRKMKIIDMLTADRENGPALRKSRLIWVLAIFFEVFSVWMCVTGVAEGPVLLGQPLCAARAAHVWGGTSCFRP